MYDGSLDDDKCDTGQQNNRCDKEIPKEMIRELHGCRRRYPEIVR
jgi:hypothetical protein